MKKYITASLLALTLSTVATAAVDWKIEKKKDPMTDAMTVLVAQSDQDDKVAFIYYCKASRPGILLKTERFIGTSKVSMEARIDDGPVEFSEWFGDRTGTAILFPVARETNDYLDRLLKAHTLAMRMKDYRGAQSTHVFDLKGLTKAYNEIKEHCQH